MNQTPNPLNKNNLSRATFIAIGLAVGGIVLFFILWGVLGSTGMDAFARLILSLCIPPGLMAALIGVYFLLAQPRQ
jgi:lipopolysaccharide export LptBFGC system permease protein LptF